MTVESQESVLVECVPNISEGRDRAKIDLIVAAAAAVAEVEVLDVDPGADTHRTVITLVGPPVPIAEAAFRLVKKAAELIDMTTHQGAHARHGATDVCPFIPVSGISMEDCIEIARGVGKRIGDELGIPVYMYDRAALRDDRKSLADVRKGEYEALPEKLIDNIWEPDFGPAEFLPRTGVITVGAREFLIAYNVNLNTRDKSQANDLAMEIREKGRAVRVDPKTPYYSSGKLLRYLPSEGIWPSGITGEIFPSRDLLEQHLKIHDTTLANETSFFGQDPDALEGEMVMKRGSFEHCRAVGWVIPEYGQAQISINLTDFHVTNMHHVVDACRTLATVRGLAVTGSEVVGVVPHDAIIESGEHYLETQGSSRGIPIADRIETAIQSLGLSDITPFETEKSILGTPSIKGTLTGLDVADFVDEVSRDSPAPGGGSIAALAGSLAAALSSMVANLTFAKRKFRKRRPQMEALSIEAQAVKDELLRAVDQDTAAFEAVIDAMRLPQGTAEQKELRDRAIEAGYRHATEVPLTTARLCQQVMDLALRAAEQGLPSGITDAGTACWMARAGLEGAILNVRINLLEITDQQWRNSVSEKITLIQDDARSTLDLCQKRLEEILGS